MSNPYGWGQNEPQIKPKDQGGDTIATFSQKIYNLFNNLFNTLNSYPWSAATQSDVGYMSAADKTKLDGLISTNATQSAAGYMSAADKTNLDSSLSNGAVTAATVDTTKMTGSASYRRLGRYIIVSIEGKLTSTLSTYNGTALVSGLPVSDNMPGFFSPASMAFFDNSTYYGAWLHYSQDGKIYLYSRGVSIPANLQFYGYTYTLVSV